MTNKDFANFRTSLMTEWPMVEHYATYGAALFLNLTDKQVDKLAKLLSIRYNLSPVNGWLEVTSQLKLKYPESN